MLANIIEIEEVDLALANGAEGIGLLRSEFLFQERPNLPSEEEQYAAYRHVADLMGPDRLVTIRTLDPDWDKPIPGITIPNHHDVAGFRGIRLARLHPEIFRLQIRAILRAAVTGNLQIMLPMVTTIDDIRFARSCIATACQELAESGRAYRADVPVGIMIETPAAAVTADLLIGEADFFSIGTNDLTQYTLVVDRAESRLIPFYDPHDVAVLRLIWQASEAAHAVGKPVSVCGEMAADPNAISLLVGIGIRQLSISPMNIPRIKETVQRLDSHESALAVRQRLSGNPAD